MSSFTVGHVVDSVAYVSSRCSRCDELGALPASCERQKGWRHTSTHALHSFLSHSPTQPSTHLTHVPTHAPPQNAWTTSPTHLYIYPSLPSVTHLHTLPLTYPHTHASTHLTNHSRSDSFTSHLQKLANLERLGVFCEASPTPLG